MGLAPNQAGATNPSHVYNLLRTTPSLAYLRDTHGDNKNRYFYTDKYGWVDIRHFAESARLVYENMQAGWWVKTKGFGLEIYQWSREWGNDYRSGFSPEDMCSNAAGVDFAQSIRPRESLSDAFARWETQVGARPKRHPLSRYVYLPPTDPSLRPRH